MSVKNVISTALISSLFMTSTHAAISQPPMQIDPVAAHVEQVKNFSDIDNAFTQYQYEMDGWDGSNLDLKKDAQQRLNDELNALIASGVSVKEIQTVMEERILNPKSRAEYRLIVEALKMQKASPDQIAIVAMNFMNNSQATGSAFSSDGARINYKKIALVAGAILLATVTVILIKNCKEKNVDPNPPVPPIPPGDPEHGNNGWGNGDQDPPGNSCSHNNAENYDCV